MSDENRKASGGQGRVGRAEPSVPALVGRADASPVLEPQHGTANDNGVNDLQKRAAAKTVPTSRSPAPRNSTAGTLDPIAEIETLLTPEDVAKRLKISRSAAYALVHRLGRTVRIGRSLRVTRAVIEAFVAEGGDERCVDEPESISSDEATPTTAYSETPKASGSGRARTKRIDDWQKRLLASSSSAISRTNPRR